MMKERCAKRKIQRLHNAGPLNSRSLLIDTFCQCLELSGSRRVGIGLFLVRLGLSCFVLVCLGLIPLGLLDTIALGFQSPYMCFLCELRCFLSPGSVFLSCFEQLLDVFFLPRCFFGCLLQVSFQLGHIDLCLGGVSSCELRKLTHIFQHISDIPSGSLQHELDLRLTLEMPRRFCRRFALTLVCSFVIDSLRDLCAMLSGESTSLLNLFQVFLCSCLVLRVACSFKGLFACSLCVRSLLFVLCFLVCL